MGSYVVKAVRRDRPDAVVFLGDLQAQRPLHDELTDILNLTDVWWIPGKHDTDSDADDDNLFGSALADRNLHGRGIEIAGLRIAGLGGVFRGQIWMPLAPADCASQAELVRRCGKVQSDWVWREAVWVRRTSRTSVSGNLRGAPKLKNTLIQPIKF